jgi:dTDP-glucose 4,6-dehydratase
VEADVTEELSVTGPVDVIYHLATPTSPVDYLTDPVGTMTLVSDGVRNVLELARATGASIVLASSSEVYGEGPGQSDGGQVPDRSATGVFAAYNEGRRFSEALASAYHAAYGVSTSVARIFNTYGPRMKSDECTVPRLIRQALAGRPVTVPGRGLHTRSLCYVADTVEGLIALGEMSFPAPVNIGNPAETTTIAVAREVLRATDSASSIDFVDGPDDERPTRLPDITMAREVIDWKPEVPLVSGLEQTIDWFRTAIV